MTKKDILFLKDLAEKLKTQDTFSTRKPVMYTIKDFYWEKVSAGDWWDRVTIKFGGREISTEELINKTLESDINEQCRKEIEELVSFSEKISGGQENVGETLSGHEIEDLVDTLSSVQKERVEVTFEMREDRQVPGTFFFTKEAAEKHLEENRHRYTEDAFLFIYHIFRSTEIERLLEIIETEDWGAYGWDAPEEEA